MALYRKLPITIEAEEFLGFDEHIQEGGILSQADIKRESLAIVHCPKCDQPFSRHGRVPTLEGEHIACPGDYIIKGINGEFYPCKPDIFKKTYEEV